MLFDISSKLYGNRQDYSAILKHAKTIGQYFHYWVSALLVLALVPALKHLHIPVRFDWERLVSLYWLVLSAQAIFVAALLFGLGVPCDQGLKPFWHRLLNQKFRIVFILIYFLILLWAFQWVKAVMLTVDAIALLEYLERTKTSERCRKLIGLVAPAFYLFVGFLLVFAYNDIIVSIRFFGADDSIFKAMDAWLLHGGSVSGISHWALSVFPISAFKFLEFIYYGMFPQVGAALLISTLYYGKQRGMQFVGAILTAYYLALALFYLWPSQGPYWLCPTHFSALPQNLETFAVQQQLLANAQKFWNHTPPTHISTDYYIAFPCMHIAQPLIVMWFLRQWRRTVLALAIYDLILVAAILFLEWHYLIDILASFPLAGLAIASVDGSGMWMWLTRQENQNSQRMENIRA